MENPNDCFCLVFENCYSLGIFTARQKIRRINDLIHKYDVDSVAGCEARCDWYFVEGEDSRNEILYPPEKPTRSTKGNNIIECVNRDQWGGTAMTNIGRFFVTSLI